MYLYLGGGGILHFGRVVVGYLLGMRVVFFLVEQGRSHGIDGFSRRHEQLENPLRGARFAPDLPGESRPGTTSDRERFHRSRARSCRGAHFPLVRPGIQGHRLSHRKDRLAPRRRLHA